MPQRMWRDRFGNLGETLGLLTCLFHSVRTDMLSRDVAGKIQSGETAGAFRKQVRGKSQSVDTVAFALKGLGARSGEQSGDLQGLSNVQGADSESVDELLEQGNAFEAEVVKGVEDAGDADGGEVHTHEVPQDDVPGEYLDKNQ
jgi:hypothetical protein